MKPRVGQVVKIVRGDIHEGKIVTISTIQGTACYGKHGDTLIGFKMSETVPHKEDLCIRVPSDS